MTPNKQEFSTKRTFSFDKSKKLLRFIAPHKWYFIAGLGFLLFSSIASLAFPKLTGDLVDADNLEKTNEVGLLLLSVFLANAIFSYFRIYLFEYVTQNMLASLRQAVYSHVISLPMTFFSARRVGELNSRISADVSLLQTTFTTTLAELIRQVIVVLGGMVMLSSISLRLTGFMLALIPMFALAAVFFGRFIRKLSKTAQNKVAESNTIVEETLQGISTVKAFANELLETIRYRKTVDEITQISMKAAKYRGAFVSFIIFCLFGSLIAVIWYGVVLREQGEMSNGMLISFVLYSVFLGASTAGIADLFSQLQKAMGSAEHLLELLDEDPEQLYINATEKSSPTLPVAKGNIRFQNVSFAYPSRKESMVLKNISFRIGKGERVALVGPSGTGKSTIVSLLLRFYDSYEGDIMLDGKELRTYPLHWLRNQVAVVPQDVLLFGGTIRENILYGKPDAFESGMISAAKKAYSHDFIERFPEKYETIVGERGVQLSGGQRQRIAIARAILKNPSILILDEATSSLDSESERYVQMAFDELMNGRTSIVIAHRLSTVRKSDRILVIDRGRIAEEGTHEQLIANTEGLYKSLSALQLMGE